MPTSTQETTKVVGVASEANLPAKRGSNDLMHNKAFKFDGVTEGSMMNQNLIDVDGLALLRTLSRVYIESLKIQFIGMAGTTFVVATHPSTISYTTDDLATAPGAVIKQISKFHEGENIFINLTFGQEVDTQIHPQGTTAHAPRFSWYIKGASQESLSSCLVIVTYTYSWEGVMIIQPTNYTFRGKSKA